MLGPDGIERSRPRPARKYLVTRTRAAGPAGLQEGKYNDVGTVECQDQTHRVQLHLLSSLIDGMQLSAMLALCTGNTADFWDSLTAAVRTNCRDP